MEKFRPSIQPPDVTIKPNSENGGSDPEFLQLGKNYILATDGADKFGRFRYQATCAAIYGLTMLDEDSEHGKLYCEALEDFTMERKDGKLTAVQVKSRDRGLEPFKTSDEEILSSLLRFAKYEKTDATTFNRYVIATNIGFRRAGNNWLNLRFLIKHTRSLTSKKEIESDKEIRKACEALKKHTSNFTSGRLRDVFAKLELDEKLPDMSAAKAVLGEELNKRCEDKLQVDEFNTVVLHLIEFFCCFSSRAFEDVTGATQALSSDPEATAGAMRVQSRTVTPEILHQHIEEGIRKAKQYRRRVEEINEEPLVTHSDVSFSALTRADLESIIRNAIDSIQRFREQYEWDKVNRALAEAMKQLDLHSNLAQSETAFDLYMVGAETEAENADRSDETSRQRHIEKAQWYIRKARETREK